jgi:predicted Mrr-cat superfamily restriction endonuclease
LLFDEGFLSIGWRDVAKEFPNIRENENSVDPDFRKKCVDKCYGGDYFRSITSLKNFIHFKKNDLIVVPTGNKDFAVCEVLEDKTYIPSEMEQGIIAKYDLGSSNVDLGFFKKVKILDKEISRYKFADKALTARMKMRQTNASIIDIEESIKRAIERKPISLYGDLSDECSKEALKNIHKSLDPNKVEKLVASYFKCMGASVEVNPEKNLKNKSGDVDILATFEALRLIICVQAKHHERDSDEWAVKQINEYYEGLKKEDINKEDMDDGYSKILWVISTCDKFNKSAIDEAAKYKVHLINGIEFARMLLDVGLKAFEIEE